MMHIRRGRTILAGHTVRIRRKCSETVRAAHGAVVHVSPSERDVPVHPGVYGHDQLVLVVNARGLHQQDLTRSSEREHAGTWNRGYVSVWQWCVDVRGAQQVESVRICERDRDG